MLFGARIGMAIISNDGWPACVPFPWAHGVNASLSHSQMMANPFVVVILPATSPPIYNDISENGMHKGFAMYSKIIVNRLFR